MPITSPWMTLEPYPKMNLAHFLEAGGAGFGDKAATISPDGKEYSFSQIIHWSKKLARFLQDEGVAKGDRVGIFSPNCPEYLVAVQGILRAGAVATTLNSMYKEGEVHHQLEDSGAVVLLVARVLMPVAQSTVEKLPNVRRVYCMEDLWEWAKGTPPEPLPVEIDPVEDLAVLPYSSGTTGLPKGVMLTHFNLTSNIRQMLAIGYTNANSVGLHFLPFFHIYGQTILMNSGFASGGTQIVLPGFNPEQILTLIEKHKVTDMFTVPPALVIMLNHPSFSQYDKSSLHYIYSGAAPLPLELAKQATRAFNCPLINGYGLTETSPLINTQTIHMIKLDAVGAPVSDTMEKVVDLDTDEELPAGKEGELLVKGPQIMKGYWNQPQATAETLTEDGWLRTGDIGYVDKDSYVHIVDRKKELIKYKGYQIAPAELEALLLTHPAVLDSAVIPKPQADGSDFPKAFVVLRPGATASAEEIQGFVEERVAPYKKVRELEFVEVIPKSLTGKILRRELIERERRKDAPA
jgi:acyl-CoA synthetase (AMP-forming)/AMP-acid ligase II